MLLTSGIFTNKSPFQIVISTLRYFEQIKKNWRCETKYKIISNVDDDFDVISLVECEK